MTTTRFTRGDFIEVTAAFGTVRGAALDTRTFTGYAVFQVDIGGETLTFNLNEVKVQNLFRADIARETGVQNA